MSQNVFEPRLIAWIIDVVTRLSVEKTFVEGGYVARSHVDRACREAGVEKQRTRLLTLLMEQGVLIRAENGDYYVDPTRARQAVSAMKGNAQLSGLTQRERKQAIQRLCAEAGTRRELRKRALASGAPPLTSDLAIAFNALRSMVRVHDGQHRVCIPAELHEIDDAWLEDAFVPVTRRVECLAGMETLLENGELFRRVGLQQASGTKRVVYAFKINPNAVAINLPDTAPVPRPVSVSSARVLQSEMRAAILNLTWSFGPSFLLNLQVVAGMEVFCEMGVFCLRV